MKKDDMPLCNEMKECFARTMGGGVFDFNQHLSAWEMPF